MNYIVGYCYVLLIGYGYVLLVCYCYELFSWLLLCPISLLLLYYIWLVITMFILLVIATHEFPNALIFDTVNIILLKRLHEFHTNVSSDISCRVAGSLKMYKG